jgi:thymidylate synthase ThyX
LELSEESKIVSKELIESLRWQKFPIGSDGFVCLVDVMGDDAAVVQAARVSYGNEVRLHRDSKEVQDKLFELFPGGGTSQYKAVDCDAPDWSQAQLQEAYEAVRAVTLASDRTLLRYMVRHNHGTPFEMAEVKLLVRCPMDVWRQWIRHRTANVNEYLTRYTQAIDSAAVTRPDEWRVQSTTNKQGSGDGEIKWPAGYELWPIDGDGDFLLGVFSKFVLTKEEAEKHRGWSVVLLTPSTTTDTRTMPTVADVAARWDFPYKLRSEITPGYYLQSVEIDGLVKSRDVYEERLRFGVAREQARKDLPLSTYTEAYWKCDLRNLLHFLGLRMDGHAQKEIREFATAIGEKIVAPLFPFSWEAFQDYQFQSMRLSRLEIEAIQDLRLGISFEEQPFQKLFTNKRELEECRAKLERLGLIPTRV